MVKSPRPSSFTALIISWELVESKIIFPVTVEFPPNFTSPLFTNNEYLLLPTSGGALIYKLAAVVVVSVPEPAVIFGLVTWREVIKACVPDSASVTELVTASILTES